MSLLNDRFEIVDEIGRGSQAVTHRAIDHDTGEEVALKELDFRRVEDWKSMELFEREGETLQGLDHPAIPRYVDAFAIEEDDEVRLFLAQEYIAGPTLQDELDHGEHWSEEKARKDALQLLDALEYLHSLSPPVIHRDIKPSNIIRRDDGRLALVDFGAVQNIVPKTVGGSTIIGTPGYMPVEQVMGRAVPGSDLYALGATLIHLLTRTAPSELPVQRNRLQFRDRVHKLSSGFLTVLEELTDPSVEDRLDSSARARDRIDSRSVVVSGELPAVHYPPWATVSETGGTTQVKFNTFGLDGAPLDVSVQDDDDGLMLLCRGDGTDERDRKALYGLAAFAVGMLIISAPIEIAIFTIVAMLLLSLRFRGKKKLEKTDVRLVLDSDGYALDVGDDRHEGEIAELAEAEVDGGTLWLVERGGDRVPVFSLAPEDRFRWKWIVSHLNRRLGELRPTELEVDEREEFWKAEPAEVEV